MDKINHEVFGELSYDYGWKRELKVNLFGHERLLILDIDSDEDAEFEDAQVNAYQQFFKNKDILLKSAEDSILKYYLDVNDDYRQRLGVEFADEKAPILTTKEELANLIIPTQLIFPMVFDEDVRQVGLLLDCSWEPEHGLAVKFENEEVVEVGFQDIVL
ncbi:DUF6985 domain-containing protein [Bacillus atrophaeus]|uniref:DUF6985 domain-containing protein n=1 Tax=Bacillus atrophaeus TaxID=1452 RepID=UPI002DB688B3|nr:hypothetical protein [Bacillus atrophaeus]MEC0766840.1 hypothetical protein [Bacillus atrophaeus]MEC0780742.1 hypothetical protein [Bacillus atrophaeus]MEC0807119.1 hypothetical protein [Bacillus atrophaeus]